MSERSKDQIIQPHKGPSQITKGMSQRSFQLNQKASKN